MAERPFYSITFGDKNTWDEWALMPVREGKIEIATPELKSHYVDIEGADNSLDLTEVLTGYPLFKSREGSLKFRFYKNGVSARTRFNSLKNYLHGRRMRAVVADELDYYYYGRFTVGDYSPAKKGDWGEVTIGYLLDAYKLEVISASDRWEWSPFNFETGVIREFNQLAVGGTDDTGGITIEDLYVTLTGVGKPQPLSLTVERNTWPATSELQLTLSINDGDEIRISSYGTTILTDQIIAEGEYELHFRGNALVTINYRGGIL